MKNAWVDVIGWSGILFWIGVSAFAASSSDGGLFQSSGTIGISAGVIYFVLQRHSDSVPKGLHIAFSEQGKTVSLVAHMVTDAQARIALLAKSLEIDANRSGARANEVVRSLANVPDTAIEKTLQHHSDDFAQRIDEVGVAQENANYQVQLSRRTSEVFQAVVIVVGTLQTGFGERLVSSWI